MKLPEDIIHGAEVSTVPSVPLTKARISLVQWGLVGIAGFIAAVMVGYALKEYQCARLLECSQREVLAGRVDEVGYARLNELMGKVREDLTEFRKFIKEMIQMILLNALFPALTALLGYAFGTKQT
ncbi:MAG: hypothetical protein AB1611_05295 [bacterium]